MTAIGFTGTRHGMTDAQRDTLRRLLKEHIGAQFHHGCCVGADAQAAKLARETVTDCWIVAHPGNHANGGSAGWLDTGSVRDANEVRPTLTHFARNREIVTETSVLFAAPLTAEPITAKTMGGTAYTVNYARKLDRFIHIILPDGTLMPD